ncbi:unnamed protein product [Adineta ricciae]|uniref:Uncharacterized protein n=1 Tax=Adineta ricciae TaxID=249248 RepID=A0A815RK75_ADIRI|nr:unnamed protein product [Adineta ricciae]CAF1478164.1 unnamed protein product [Adineta ricciae]
MKRSTRVLAVRAKKKPNGHQYYSQSQTIQTKPFSSTDPRVKKSDIALNQSDPTTNKLQSQRSSSLTHFDSFYTTSHSKASFSSRIEPFSTSKSLGVTPNISLFNKKEVELGNRDRYDHYRRHRRHHPHPLDAVFSCCSPCCCLASSLLLALVLVSIATLVGLLIINTLSTTAKTTSTSTAFTTSTVTVGTTLTSTSTSTSSSVSTTTSTVTITTTDTTTVTMTTETTTQTTSSTTTTGIVSISSTRGNYYARDAIVISCSTPWTNLTIEIIVPKTVGATFNGQSNSFSTGQVTQSYVDTGTEIIYTWKIVSGQTISCANPTYNVAAQYNLSGTPQPNNVDSYTITLTTSTGVTTVQSGYF